MAFKLENKPTRNHSPRSKYGHGPEPSHICIHHWGSDGQLHRNVVDWLRGITGNRNSSAHYVTSAGLVTKLADHNRATWHAGTNKGNGESIGIECRPELSDGDWETLVELCVSIENEEGSLNYTMHSNYKATECPGRYRNKIDELIAAVNAYHESGKVPERKSGSDWRPPSQGRSYQTVNYGETLGRWDKGDPVKDWQEFLEDEGYNLDDGVDGFFGGETEEHTEDWQEQNGLVADGLIGDKSLAVAESQGFEWTRRKDNGQDEKRAPETDAPEFELPDGHWYGVESRNPKNHSGYWAEDRPAIRKWQGHMKNTRGWGAISVTGRFKDSDRTVLMQFQEEKGLSVDGGLGVESWNASWDEPIT